MSLFRKLPVVIEARQLTFGNSAEIARWCGGAVEMSPNAGDGYPMPHLTIPTLEGPMTFRAGWWVIKGVAGEFYAVDPSVFEATYEPVDEGSGADAR